MAKLTLYRMHNGETSTIGRLHFNDEFFCFTCEDEYREIKIAGKTRIPAGTYDIILRDAGGMNKRYHAKYPHIHRGMLHLQDVEGFEWVYIHVGNTHEDTLGCILVGNSAQLGDDGGRVNSSAAAYYELYLKIIAAVDLGEQVTITIIDEHAR